VPTLTLDFDVDSYGPNTDYPWPTATPSNPPGGAPIPDTWSAWVEWLDIPNMVFGLGDDTGIYIIERAAMAGAPPEPLYAGKALSFANRFNGRSNVLHEFGLTAAVLPNYTLRLAEVDSNPAYLNHVSLAETWLIRFLYAREWQAGAGPHMLQNIAKTGSFTAPANGLSIRYDPNHAPWYLHDAIAANFAGWVAPAANSVGFNYAPNSVVMP
jgi:hypothetical protein